MEWISIEDKVPEESTKPTVFFISDGENVGMGWYNPEYWLGFPESCSRCPHALWSEESDLLNCDPEGFPQVTHWMPFFLLPPEKEMK